MSELVDKTGKPIPRGRIRPALASAIRLIEEEGFSIADAAQAVGYKTHSLDQALRKPHVRAFRGDVKRAWRNSETSHAFVVVAKLARDAASEDVKLKAARTLLELDEKSRAGMSDAARQLVQINVQSLNLTGQPPSQQMPGIIEAPAYQVLTPDASNSKPVGRADSDEEGA